MVVERSHTRKQISYMLKKMSTPTSCEYGVFSEDASAANNWCGVGCKTTADCASSSSCMDMRAAWGDTSNPVMVQCKDFPNYVCDGIFPPNLNMAATQDVAALNKVKVCQINAGINPYYACAQAVQLNATSDSTKQNTSIKDFAAQCASHNTTSPNTTQRKG